MLRKVENSATLFRWIFQESEQILSSKKFCIWSSEAFTAVSNLSEMAWRTRRWLSKSGDALNNEHGRKLSLSRFAGIRISISKSAFFGKRVPEETSATLLSPMSENNLTVDFIYITIRKILVVHVDADCARGWGLNILTKTINFVLTLCFRWLSGSKSLFVFLVSLYASSDLNPWNRFLYITRS